MNPTGDIQYYQMIPRLCPENDIAIAYIHHQWDHIAWCAGVIFQRELSTLGVISSYYDKTALV